MKKRPDCKTLAEKSFFEVSPEEKDYLKVTSAARAELRAMRRSVTAVCIHEGVLRETRIYADFLLLRRT